MERIPITKSSRGYWFWVGIVLLALIVAFWVYRIFWGTSHVDQPALPLPITEEAPTPEQPHTTPVVPVTPKPQKSTTTSSHATTSPVVTTPATTTPLTTERFVVPRTATTTPQIIDTLFEAGFIEDKTAFAKAFATSGITGVLPGGYKLSKDMSATQIIKTLQSPPYMRWVIIPPGLRKEEIGELLGRELSWTSIQKEKWTSTYTAMKFDYIEGVYFPDSYLIPISETPLEVANRIIAKFNERFTPYISQFAAQNMKWTTGLVFASIVQREAANTADMPLIAGILWNRLTQGIPLQADATLQYVRGNTGSGWWAPIRLADKQIDSPYNTYKNKGLPPHPISNPGIGAIEAVLKPAATDCLYYLHDKNRITHCAVTYEEHQANIQKYLVEGGE